MSASFCCQLCAPGWLQSHEVKNHIRPPAHAISAPAHPPLPQRARGPRALQLQPAVGLSRAGAAALPTGLHPAPGGAGAAGRGKEEKVGRRLLVCLAYRCDPVYMISALCRTPGKRLLRRSQLAHGAPLLPTAPLCSPWRPTVLCVSTQPTSIQQLKVRPLLVHVLQVFFCPPHHPSPVGPCLSPCSCATRLTRLLFHEPVTRHSPPTLPAPVLHCPCLRPLFVPAGLNSFDCFAPFDLDDKFKAIHRAHTAPYIRPTPIPQFTAQRFATRGAPPHHAHAHTRAPQQPPSHTQHPSGTLHYACPLPSYSSIISNPPC